MINNYQISIPDWHQFLLKISEDHTVYVPVKTYEHIEYKIYKDNIIVAYNIAKPVTPLKNFFLPVKENVIIEKNKNNKKIIIGIPACDLNALGILDEIYLDDNFIDPTYKENRENTLLVGSDCFEINESCHCNSYGLEPYPVKNADASIALMGDNFIITAFSDKGESLIAKAAYFFPIKTPDIEYTQLLEKRRKSILKLLEEKNKSIPDYKTTGDLIRKSGDEIWMRHSKTCVSCGACATICPTCTCFLLIDRPDFEKVRQVDACQYPGFERIAAGEDPLHKKFVRFRNRYLCKYVWKPESFKSIACTGCGRCIDSCIGNINKNKIFIEMNTPA
jgi:ferredoxin